MRGGLFNWYLCAKHNNEYRLFFIGNKNELAGKNLKDNVSGRLVTLSGDYEERIIFKKGEFTLLRLGNSDTVPIYHAKTKVLAMKPNRDDFEKKFTFAEVVSGPHDSSRSIILSDPPPGRENNRHSYKLLFDGETTPRVVNEEFIVPIKKYWGIEKEVYDPSDSSSDSDSDTDESSSTSSSSLPSSDDSSSSEPEQKKHKSHKKRKTHKEQKKKRHHKNKKSSHPNIVIVPIFIPFPQMQFY